MRTYRDGTMPSPLDLVRRTGDARDLDLATLILTFCRRNLVWLALVYAGLFLLVSALVPATHDYRAYLQQWQAVAEGQDPWRASVPLGGNAYGPLHNLYGLIAMVDPRGPRLLGSVLWLAAVWSIAIRILDTMLDARWRLGLLMAVTLNPFSWGWVAVFGSNDAIVAALMTFAALTLDRRNSATAGLFIALASLMKFYPLLVIPFIAFDRRRFDLSFTAAALSVFGLGMAVAAAIWGKSIAVPLFFAAGREPSQLSLYAFLATSVLSPLKGVVVPARIVQAIFAIVGLAVFFLHVWRRGDQISGLMLGLLTLLTAYQLGHFQFYLPLILIVPLGVVLLDVDAIAAGWLMAVVATASFFATCYLAFGGLVAPPWLSIRQNAGLPTFMIEAVALVVVLRAKVTRPRNDSRIMGP